MKIFNWVHQKFHRSDNKVVYSSLHKDDLCSDQRTIEKVAVDKQALLGQEVALVDVLGGWKDGILTIGTLGFDDPLKSFPFNYNEIEEVHDEEDPEERVDEERENDDEAERSPLVKFVEVITDCERPEIKKKNGERTTLADLLSVDFDDDDDNDVKRELDHASEALPKSESSSSDHAGKKKTRRSSKNNGISFAKKLIPRVGDDSRPIKKLNQLMTRMMKRKIHPEVGGKINKSDGQIKPNACGLLSTEGLGSNEQISLLQTQVVAI